MTATLPKVAVVMTAFDAAETIGASLTSALRQDYAGPLSVVVVDDGSTDATRDVVASLDDPRITLVGSARVGRARALNLALGAAADAEVIANLDADDYMLPARVSTQVTELLENRALGAIGSAYYELHLRADGAVDRAFRVTPPPDPAVVARQMTRSFAVCHSCATYWRSAALDVGGFDERLTARIDFDLWLRLASSGRGVGNSRSLLGIHTKRSGTWFDRQFSPVRSAGQMARLNFAAARRLAPVPLGYVEAAARLGYSLLRRSSVKPVPRYGVPLAAVPDDVRSVMASVGR